MSWQRTVLFLSAAAPLLCNAQNDAARARELLGQGQRPVLPNSVTKVKAQPSPVLVIPDAELFKGLDLSETQRAALTSRLKTIPFQTFQKTLSDRDILAQRLPSGELFQVLKPGAGAMTTIQQTLAAPGAPTDPCAAPDHTDEEITALKKVLAAQLTSKSGDVSGFNAAYPTSCRRKQLVYLGKSAVLVAQ